MDEIKIMTITTLRDDLATAFEEIKTETLDLKKAQAINKTAGRIIQTAKLEMEYNTNMGKPEKIIPFLES